MSNLNMNEVNKRTLQSFSILAKKISDLEAAGGMPSNTLLKEFVAEENSIAAIANTHGPEIEQNWEVFLASPLLKPSERSAIEKSATLARKGNILSSTTQAAFSQAKLILGGGGAIPKFVGWRCLFLAAACGAAAGSGEIPFAIYIAGEIISSC